MLMALPLGLVGILLFAGFMASAEIGYIAHRRFGRGGGGETETSDESQVLQGALVLLALLLGFTFSMALARHEDRRQMVIAEANNIGTAWLRAGLIEGPDGAALQDRLHDYARSRIVMAGSHATSSFEAALAEGARLRSEIWPLAAAATAPIRTTAQAASLIESVNAVIDVATSREQAINARVPERVITLLIVYSVVSAFLLGYVMGAFGVHHRAATGVLFVLLAMTIVLILDLDQPGIGTISVSQQPMADLIADMERPVAKPLPIPAP